MADAHYFKFGFWSKGKAQANQLVFLAQVGRNQGKKRALNGGE